MLIDIMENLTPKNDLKNIHKGIVVKNDDPLKLGRVKAVIKGIFEDTSNDYAKLPWITCFNPQCFGNNKGSINPPKINSKIRVIWLDNADVYFPSYDGYWLDKTNSPTIADGFYTEFQNDYPNVYGSQDTQGNYEIVNNTQGFTERGFEGGYKVKINKDGILTEIGLKEYIISVLNKYQLDSNNILLGTGTGHKQLVTKEHLDTKYNAFLTFLQPLYATLSSASIDPATIAFATAVNTSINSFKDNNNFTSETKAK